MKVMRGKKPLCVASAVFVTTLLLPHTGFAQSEPPSDSSLAQLQQQDQATSDAQGNLALKIIGHSLSLVHGVVDELESSHVKFDSMPAVISSARGLSPLLEFGMAIQAGNAAHYLGANNEIAYTAFGKSMLVAFQPDNGSPVVETFGSDLTTKVSFSDVNEDDEIDDDPEGFLSGSDDKAIIAEIKEDVRNSLDPGGSASDDDQSDQTGTSDGSQAASPDSGDDQAGPPAPLSPSANASAIVPSFDCGKANGAVSHMICSSPALSSLDDQLASAYKAARAATSNPASLRHSEIRWIKERDTCTTISCVEQIYSTRIAYLKSLAPAPLSSSVLNTLMKLQALQDQTKPPTARYNPAQASTSTAAPAKFSGADRDAIGNHVRPCWTIDAGAPGVAGFSVLLTVTTDATGTVRDATVAPADQGKMSSPAYASYAQRAIEAVENYQCATLPLPSYMLGHSQTFTFEFSP